VILKTFNFLKNNKLLFKNKKSFSFIFGLDKDLPRFYIFSLKIRNHESHVKKLFKKMV